MANQKQTSQLKLLQVLQNCKQIPKDDRLQLRKYIKQGDEKLITILSDPTNKRLQILLRKYLQRCKENRRIQTQFSRQSTIVDMKAICQEKERTPVPRHRSVTHSLQKLMHINPSISKGKPAKDKFHERNARNKTDTINIKDIRDIRDRLNQLANKRSISATKQEYRMPLHTKYTKPSTQCSLTTDQPSNYLRPSSTVNSYIDARLNISVDGGVGEKLNRNWAEENWFKSGNDYNESRVSPIESLSDLCRNTNFYANPNAYLYQNGSLYTSPQLLNWHPTRTPTITNSIANSRTSAMNKQAYEGHCSNSDNWLHTNTLLTAPSKVCFQQNVQQNIYNFKCVLIRHYAQDIFDYITSKHFPLSLIQKSVYLPYRQLIKQIQMYLQSKGQLHFQLQLFKETDVKIPILQPFTSEYEGITLQKLGIFLNKFCLRKNNNIKGMFIVIRAQDEEPVTVQKFNKINSWKGNQVTEKFQVLVKKWGNCNTITYWQLYRVRKQIQYTNFDLIYSKI